MIPAKRSISQPEPVAFCRRLTEPKEETVKWLRVVPMIAAAMVFAMPAAPAVAGPVVESFETDFGGWEADSDGLAPAWSVKRSTDQAYHGTYSAQIFMNGLFDDGTTWIERQFFATPNQTVTVTLTFQLWSPVQAPIGSWTVVAIAGKSNPEQEIDFDNIGHTEAAAGWKQYTKTWTFTADSTGGFWVALGTSVVWEVEKFHYIDYVEVTVS